MGPAPHTSRDADVSLGAAALVVQVAFFGWTRHDLLRQGQFVGFREDKPAHTVSRDQKRTCGLLLLGRCLELFRIGLDQPCGVLTVHDSVPELS